MLYDAAAQPELAKPTPIDEATPEQLKEVTDTYGALPAEGEATTA